jgi:hypothetical protein
LCESHRGVGIVRRHEQLPSRPPASEPSLRSLRGARQQIGARAGYNERRARSNSDCFKPATTKKTSQAKRPAGLAATLVSHDAAFKIAVDVTLAVIGAAAA